MIRSILHASMVMCKHLMGRKRWLRDINSANFTIRAFAERNAINSPIQGTAADMIKLAMVKIHQVFQRKEIQVKNDFAGA